MKITNNGQRQLVERTESLREIAALLGVTAPAVAKWKRGHLPRDGARAAMLAKLGIAVAAWTSLDPHNVDASAPPKNRGGRRRKDAPPRAARAVVAPPTPPATPPDHGKPSYPPAPPLDASTIVSVRHTLACIRADLQQRDLTLASVSKLRADESRTLQLLARLEREDELTEARYVREHPAFRAHCRRILEALKPYPKAAQAVAAALGSTAYAEAAE